MEPARDPTPRWHYRYDNFHRAHSLLREAVELMQERALTPLEQEGAIQRFEYCWELAWKTLKDYLEQQGIQLPTVTPAAVLRAAQAAGVIGQGEGWMRMLDTRIKLAHTYDFKAFAAALEAVRQEFLGLLDSLHGRLVDERFDKAGP
jgi:nucleotidyltransferase substrate binding protein (TIGR01987 family)